MDVCLTSHAGQIDCFVLYSAALNTHICSQIVCCTIICQSVCLVCSEMAIAARICLQYFCFALQHIQFYRFILPVTQMASYLFYHLAPLMIFEQSRKCPFFCGPLQPWKMPWTILVGFLSCWIASWECHHISCGHWLPPLPPPSSACSSRECLVRFSVSRTRCQLPKIISAVVGKIVRYLWTDFL